MLKKQKSLSRQYIEEFGDILTTTRDELPDEQGASITYLIRKANISHGRISKILNTLVSQGLLEQTSSDGACKYKISSVGREFLQAYNTFNRFADGFGLTI
ncbi:MAG: transcriptional regulator [Thaumarchaeota archaeon]|nr:transcriptional regulator [Nitrososphaerota archaeon]